MPSASTSPRIAVIGAGSRGDQYAGSVTNVTNGTVVAIAEPVAFKRNEFGQRYIWGLQGRSEPQEGEAFDGWEQFIEWELEQRKSGNGSTVDAAIVCTLDETHVHIVKALAELNLHILCEKPLATRLDDVLTVRKALRDAWAKVDAAEASNTTNGNGVSNGANGTHTIRPKTIFSVCHVLRYSPHNMLLRDLVLKQRVVGDILNVEHTEPIGWWHFSHSYVRGNWRKESTSAPSLLTKSCHDIDFLMWLLCSPVSGAEDEKPHLPSQVTSSGTLSFFKKSRKPAAAKDATNCLSCPIERDCLYSAKKLYVERRLRNGNARWPVKIVNPEIEDILIKQGPEPAEEQLLHNLAEDYGPNTPTVEVHKRPWFGRCVWESTNDVCDNQNVTVCWDDDPLPDTGLEGRAAKTVSFNMVAFTEAICERRGRIYGTEGEIEYDSFTIKVHKFATGQTETHHPPRKGGGHGGGDDGLINQFVKAVNAVKNEGQSVESAQVTHLGCTLGGLVRSNAMVFAAEEARREKKVVGWKDWWSREIGE